MSWRGLDHRTIYEMVVNGGSGAGVSMDAEQQWSRMQQLITDAERDIAAAIRTSETEWQGGGADATRTAYTSLGAWAINAAVSAQVTAAGMRGQAESAMNTRMYVAQNAPPQNFLEYLHDQVGSWDGHTIYDEQAAAVDRLMTTYERASEDNVRRFDTWAVPPTVTVTPAAAPVPPASGVAVGAMPDTGGLGAATGAGATSVGGAGGAQAPGAVAAPSAAGSTGAGGGAGPGGAAAGAPGVVPGAVAGAGSGGGAAGRVAPGAGIAGGGAAGAGGGTGAAGAGAVGAGAARGVGVGAPGAGRRDVGTGGVARPSERPPGSPGGSGRGSGPWSRAAAEAGRPAGGLGPGAGTSGGGFRPVVPTVPPVTSSPNWRSVLLPPESAPKDGAAARTAGPSGTAAASTPAAGGARPAGAVGHGGMYPPMGGAGAGGQPDERRRPSYLVDDSDAFVDKRWVCPPVITPDDPL